MTPSLPATSGRTLRTPYRPVAFPSASLPPLYDNLIYELLPPKLYLVVFYQVSLVNQKRITCSNFKRPSVLLLGSFVVLYRMFIPHGGIVINVLA